MTGSARLVPLAELLTRPATDRESVELQVEIAAPPVDPRVELERLRTQVVEEARVSGFEAGRREAAHELERATDLLRREFEERYAAREAQLEAAKAHFEAMVASIGRELERLDAQCVDDACVLAMAAVVRILGEEHGAGRVTAALCRDLLTQTRVRPATLWVPSDDAAQLADANTATDIRIAADPALKPSSCRLESARGHHETSLTSRLHAIADALATPVHSP